MTQFDPILTEVIKTELTAVAEEMGITMKRTARSLGAKEGSVVRVNPNTLIGLIRLEPFPFFQKFEKVFLAG